jgi:hypothetical protein
MFLFELKFLERGLRDQALKARTVSAPNEIWGFYERIGTRALKERSVFELVVKKI